MFSSEAAKPRVPSCKLKAFNSMVSWRCKFKPLLPPRYIIDARPSTSRPVKSLHSVACDEGDLLNNFEMSMSVQNKNDPTPAHGFTPASATANNVTSIAANFVHHEHPNLHEYVAKARQMACFSIGFTSICACVGFVFAWRSNR